MTRPWRKRIAIAGIGESDLGTVPGSDSFTLSRQALVRTIDMPVEVVFDDVTENVTIPKFRPLK